MIATTHTACSQAPAHDQSFSWFCHSATDGFVFQIELILKRGARTVLELGLLHSRR
ncbi:conserved hypothetical protein [Mesorhizobium ventifaucium]|uniref:Uncharacterized protein n=1 Tax=Mesorhizobium ventifaucium TaxID=666020 RepID=A0ABM9DK39_9HYPH|nr:conserved hypothetical protein [Mesorhizobium ventifaucium]